MKAQKSYLLRDSLFACYLAIRKADEPFSTLRLMTQTPAVWILLSQGLAPQVSSALERKADEPFATLRLITYSPAVWILNFRVRVYVMRMSITPHCVPKLILLQCGSNGWNPGPSFSQYKQTQKSYLLRDSLFACLPGDDLLSQGLAPQVSSALEVERRTSLSPHCES